MVAVAFWISFPDSDAVRHQFTHRWLEVIIAYHATGYTRSASGDTAFIYNQDISTVAFALRFQLLRQVIGGAQTMNARTDY